MPWSPSSPTIPISILLPAIYSLGRESNSDKAVAAATLTPLIYYYYLSLSQGAGPTLNRLVATVTLTTVTVSHSWSSSQAASPHLTSSCCHPDTRLYNLYSLIFFNKRNWACPNSKQKGNVGQVKHSPIWASVLVIDYPISCAIKQINLYSLYSLDTGISKFPALSWEAWVQCHEVHPPPPSQSQYYFQLSTRQGASPTPTRQ